MVCARPQRLIAEFVGTALLLATVVGSGIMAERLAGGNVALALLGNTLATGAMLYVLITILRPISGAHFNPAVSLVALLTRQLPWREFIWYLVTQLLGAGLGVVLAHLMFDLPLLQASTKIRAGGTQALSEFVATFGLLLTILCAGRLRPASTAALVGFVYQRRLLVHRVHVVRQSGGHVRTFFQRYLCRNSTARRAVFYRRAD